jgi:uncharacterized protein
VNRLEEVRKVVDAILLAQDDLDERRAGYVHLFGVSDFCSLLALKRAQNPELAAVAGMLHDISTYKRGYSPDHGRLGAQDAREILTRLNSFTDQEIDLICTAIHHHSDKHTVNSTFCELLKDADVLHHYLYNTSFPVAEKEEQRLAALLDELEVQK